MSIALKGQARAHCMQPVHFCVSIRILNMLSRSVSEANAPNGQRLLHWGRFFVRMGSTTTRATNRPTKSIVAIKLGIEFTGLYSVTSLKGQNHSQ